MLFIKRGKPPGFSKEEYMQVGEVLRRVAFNTLDAMTGGKQNRIKEVNESEIVRGITPEYEARRIEAIMDYARTNCEFYSNIPENPELKDFPVMTKMDYNTHRQEILADAYQGQEDTLAQLNTSGSTGVPFTVYADGEKMTRVYMNMLAFHELNGFRMGMKRGEFRVWIKGKNAISPWKSFKNNLKMIDISNMGDDYLATVCERIRREKIQCLVAYSSALTALTEYIERENVDISKWQVEMIYSMGEALPQSTYDLIVKVFGFAPVRSYGNNELGFIAASLPYDDRYVADLYNYHVEILKLDSDEPAEEGEVGRIVATDYYNRAFPMIRYDTGDTGIYHEEIDEEGRKHGYFTEIYGRRGSLMYNTKGEPLSIHVFMNVLLKMEGVVHQSKCIQWEKKRYELLVNADRDRLVEEDLVALYRRYLGDDAVIDVTYVDEIPVQQSGKRMVCENRCPDYQK